MMPRRHSCTITYRSSCPGDFNALTLLIASYKCINFQKFRILTWIIINIIFSNAFLLNCSELLSYEQPLRDIFLEGVPFATSSHWGVERKTNALLGGYIYDVRYKLLHETDVGLIENNSGYIACLNFDKNSYHSIALGPVHISDMG